MSDAMAGHALPAEFRGLRTEADSSAAFAGVLSPAACRFVARLAERFETARQSLRSARTQRQQQIASPIPQELAGRRVEIAGPPERKMPTNSLNSGANLYMADFEDSDAPTWRDMIEGQW